MCCCPLETERLLAARLLHIIGAELKNGIVGIGLFIAKGMIRRRNYELLRDGLPSGENWEYSKYPRPSNNDTRNPVVTHQGLSNDTGVRSLDRRLEKVAPKVKVYRRNNLPCDCLSLKRENPGSDLLDHPSRWLIRKRIKIQYCSWTFGGSQRKADILQIHLVEPARLKLKEGQVFAGSFFPPMGAKITGTRDRT